MPTLAGFGTFAALPEEQRDPRDRDGGISQEVAVGNR